MLAEHVQAKEVGRTGLGSGAGYDGDDFTGLDEVAMQKQVLGAVDQRLSAADLGTSDGRGGPEQMEAIDGDFDGAEREDGRGGVVLGELAGGAARLSEEGNAAQVEIVSCMGCGFANGLCDGEVAGALPWLGVFIELDVEFGFHNDARHHADRLHGILSYRGLAGEHDCVSAVVDGIGYI